jgi:cold shock CspA family protein
MFGEKKDPSGEKVESELVGQLDFWDEKKEFGFIQTHQDRFYCHGSAFRTHCGVKDIVKFDVWENFKTGSQKAINVKAHKPAFTVTTTDEIGTIARQPQPSRKGLVQGRGHQMYGCTWDDFEQGSFPLGGRVRFDIFADNWTGDCRAVNIRNAKTVMISGVEGKVVKLGHSYGFVSTGFCDKDLHFNWSDIKDSINCHSRVICDVMEEDGALTAANIQLWRPAIDTVTEKKPAVDDDCASTSTKAATDLSEAKCDPITPEMRKLLKKLREIDALEGRSDLDPLQTAKVAMKKEYQKCLRG